MKGAAATLYGFANTIFCRIYICDLPAKYEALKAKWAGEALLAFRSVVVEPNAE